MSEGYQPIGFFAKSAGKGKEVEVQSIDTVVDPFDDLLDAWKKEPPKVEVEVEPATFGKLQTLLNNSFFESPPPSAEEINSLKTLAAKKAKEADALLIASLKAQVAELQMKVATGDAPTQTWQGKLPIGTTLDAVTTKTWKAKAKEVSPLKLPHVFRKAEKLSVSIKESLTGPFPQPCAPEDANLISSEMIGTNSLHYPVLDIDMPCRLVPSSQPGHYHLYIEAPIMWSEYVKLMKVMRDVGILQVGFVESAIARGFSSVRPPWVKKTAEEIAESKSD